MAAARGRGQLLETDRLLPTSWLTRGLALAGEDDRVASLPGYGEPRTSSAKQLRPVTANSHTKLSHKVLLPLTSFN